jgi:hypothetical protein
MFNIIFPNSIMEFIGWYGKRAEARSFTRWPTCFSTFLIAAADFQSAALLLAASYW